ncbi:hypothetical protein GCM10007906_01600 [Vibrio hyugaensis]|uniref:Uncharacterized protein n=1 Tax=Vibrio hyugaensis TaxID=1534743 RepID=A0ABQ5XWM9_9VIBR|nr:hypothetical protein [Vibrio hyugaensis]GLR02573.1 hypothetical protein GCM10007906_01600 [Vibrio hyugaensis]
MNKHQNEVIVLGIRSITTALFIVMALIAGGGLNSFFLDQMIDISGRYGSFYFWIVMIGIATFLTWLPFTMIAIRGSKSLSKVNTYNALLQVSIALCYCIINTAFNEPLALIALTLPLVAFILLKTNAYLNFVEFYYELQKARRL